MNTTDWTWLIPGTTTGVGSLPHHNADAALAFSMSFTVPFLPQIPIRHSNEYAVPQSLEGIPGLAIDDDGGVTLDLEKWQAGKEKKNAEIDRVLKSTDATDFLPETSCWQPFCWELGQKQKRIAKIQIAGPITTSAVLRTTEKKPVVDNREVTNFITRWILARSVSMCRVLKAQGITPILVFDEPALFLFRHLSPEGWSSLQDLGVMVQALKKERAIVGIHCCSDTVWPMLMGLQPDLLSIDTHLSLPSLLADRAAFEVYWERGGRLALGIVPTHKPETLHAIEVTSLLNGVVDTLDKSIGTDFSRRVLLESLWTPACGLALHTPGQAEAVLTLLHELSPLVRKRAQS